MNRPASVCMSFLMMCGTVVLFTLVLTGCGNQQKSDLDSLLLKAKIEKRAVMLELGSVGCIPCDQMQPVISRLADEYKGRMDVYFIDVKDAPSVARQFRVYGIPTQVFLDTQGNEFHRHVGYYPYEQILPVLRKIGLGQ